MLTDELRKKYFDWMYKIVCGSEDYNNLSYKKLLSYLYNIKFTYTIDMDENRAKDGINFRYRFGYENGYSNEIIERYLDIYPCSVLEMIVALSFRVEEQIMCNSIYGNRTGQWFWNMIVSLGLGNMDDYHFDEEKVGNTIYKFLNHYYDKDGKGGLFTSENCPYDMRQEEIWTQFMRYLNTVAD